ncbi:MAG: arylsulfatase [Candidatus Symbiothrix sp.]|nr:arylsulfatase [Candidatus Symbiothrix sp.]
MNLHSVGLLTCVAPCIYAQNDARPNIIVVLVDDMGYSDLGCYGGEVRTPNIDGLAADGLRFSQFYNAGRSCPTRASLLTGVYQHQAGIGRMTFDQNLPGYKGTLGDNVVTIAEALQQAGYKTGMIGKWHVAETPLREDQRTWLAHQVNYPTFADTKNYPVNRGFDDHYGLIYGVADYFDPFSLVNGDQPVESVPGDYYITQAFSDSAVSYINRYAAEKNPFFLYLAYTAPHWPLHALPEDIVKYENTFTKGWDAIRHDRYERMKQLGIFDQSDNFLSAPPHPRDWYQDSTQVWDAMSMAVHAAMIDRIDQGIGQLITALKKNGQYENTLILFLSDNGASNERCENYSPGDNDRPDLTRDGRAIIYPKNKEVLPGPQTSFAAIGPDWANAANTPFRFWKARMYEGGICTPMIAHWPKGIQKNVSGLTRQLGHVMDIMATCIDVAETDYPQIYRGKAIIPMEGKSLVPIFKTGEREGHEYIGFEHFNEKAYRANDGWKIVKAGGKDAIWELYNLNTDRTEMHNLAKKYPDKVNEMAQLYDEWAERCLVAPAPQ